MLRPAIALLALPFLSFSGCDRVSVSGTKEVLTAPDVTLPDDTAPTAEGTTAKVVFAGGCFWCTEAAFEQITGVTDVVSGYAGGSAGDANYEAVGSGRTKHAEAIEVTYDPFVRKYSELLQVFFTAHDPTQLNYQGPDHGTQYRSTIFYATDGEKTVAKEYIDQLDAKGSFEDPIATTLEPLTVFYPAEEYHQDFVKRNPNHSYVKAWSVPKANKVRDHFPDWLK